MPSRYDALGEDSDESEDSVKRNDISGIPSYEDVSITRIDEETVLSAVYGDDFITKDGPWGNTVLCVKVRPPDTEPSKIGSQLTLNVTAGKKYPFVLPAVQFEDVKGLGKSEQVDLMQQLNARCKELCSTGSVMVCELVQLTEDFLYCHNKDPTMSAYDHMMAREEEERKVKIEKEKKLSSFMNVDENSPRRRLKGVSEHSQGAREPDVIEHDRIQKELNRQQRALNRATEEGNTDGDDSFIHNVDESFERDDGDDDDDDDDDDDYQFDEPADKNGIGSRYKSDFTEKRLLGRGGGGTVFKVRNRLDRRIYAVKKVALLSEQGSMQQMGKLENIKLRREVTTISKITHRHIVRYYQAWVEGGIRDDNLDESVKQSDEEKLSTKQSDGEKSSTSDDSSPSDDEEPSQKGFWGKKPASKAKPGSVEDSDSDSAWSSDDSESVSDNEESLSLPAKNESNPFDTDDDRKISSIPLLNGLGFDKHQGYSDLFKPNRKESVASSEDLDFQSSIMDQISSTNVKGSSSIMYIQMEYCSTTLRQLIDERKLEKMEKNECWKMIRQTLEALAYIHKQKIIHRDLKPDNIFLDAENNIRLGDFGLATTRNKKVEKSPGQTIDVTKDQPRGSAINTDSITTTDTITGGIGTPFYIAPEQARHRHSRGKNQTDYDMKADIFSLGIIIFEMFQSFSTKMERATSLQQLRGDGQSFALSTSKNISNTSLLDTETTKPIVEPKEWKEHAMKRFPKQFCATASPEIQKLIIWCLQHCPENRPSAEQLLSSDLIPRQMELDHRYLKEALHTIANPESESNEQIIKAIFNRYAFQHVEITYDTDDVAIFQRAFRMNSSKNAKIHPIELLEKSLEQIGGFTSGDFAQVIRSSVMNSLSMSAATSTLLRAKGAGKIAKGEDLRNATQHAATVLAMNSATGAAASGHVDGVNGADPRVVKSICDHLTYIFESHGAILLSPPLLRPKGPADISNPAEILNERGNNLLLPEDLQVNFARTVGRGGGALSNVKRYNIGKSYLKSISGGHPREILEASFDIVLEDQASKNEYFTAEVMMVICQALHILSPRPGSNLYGPNTGVHRPIWFLRLTHTRLADTILDLCGVPQKEPMRRACYHILTCCSAPPPCLLKTISTHGGKTMQGKSYAKRVNPKKVLSRLIEAAMKDCDLPHTAATRLRAFLNCGCLPLPLDVNDAINALQDGAKKLRSMDDQRQAMPRRQKRYEDVARGFRSVRKCINAMEAMGIHTIANKNTTGAKNYQPPAYISLDLGMRQKSHHYHGHIYFQAIMLTEDPDSVISNDTLLSGDEKGIKIAEGGRYDDLVRRFRPPGNFGASQVDKYTSAPIPVCTGVRFLIGSFVERVYKEAALESIIESQHIKALTTDSDILRRVLAIPFLAKASVQCIVVGMNGFDPTSIPERAMVASHLWANGISAEFIPHSGVILSLLRRAGADSTVSDTAEWTVDQLCDLCCILHIPFVVVVQQHLLRERKSVRLRHTIDPSSVHNGVHEIFVPLASLASEIKDRLSGTSRTNEDFDSSIPSSAFDRQSHENTSGRMRSMSIVSPDIEYIYVDTDQFHLNLEKLSGKDPKLKPLYKLMKKTQLKADPYMNDDLHTVLAVDLPFPIVRGFNSEAMFSNGPSIANSTVDFVTKHAKYRKTLKTFAMCLDFILRRCEETNAKSIHGSGTKQRMVSILIYAQPDDRFDLLTLEICINARSKNGKSAELPPANPSKGSKRDRNGRR